MQGRSGKRLRVGLIGLGSVGRLHLEAYAEARLVEVVAVADTSAVRMSGIPGPIARYSDAGAMLAEQRLDIACVLTPPAVHAPLTALATKAGVHVLCEKPLAASVGEAEAMRAACAAAGVKLFYGASYRHLPALKRAQAMILDGTIGEVLVIREHEVGGSGPDARVVLPAAHYPVGGPGGSPMGMADHGIHLIDIVPWLTGSPIAKAEGRCNVSGEAVRPEYLTLTTASGTLASFVYEEGTFATTLPGEGIFSWGASWDAGGFRPGGAWSAHPGSIHVHGTKGALRIFHYANQLFLTAAGGTQQIALDGCPAPFHFAAQIDAFAEDILNDRAPSTPAEDGVRALEILTSLCRPGA
ncbi:Inositol 2-dehydrogenase/D-chiro-inositol 3-dehydrogenase [Alphaproteobacteria bacterium SO-S41]|nr:Inositol 2-dehydrogenase/D-chiro-inositol 3-dehydrogenase [Alphaproteobacteria bacterium SO-S41]